MTFINQNILKIISNPKRGIIKITNKKGKIILKKTNLTREQVKKIEESFIEHAAKKLTKIENKNKEKTDPMIT